MQSNMKHALTEAYIRIYTDRVRSTTRELMENLMRYILVQLGSLVPGLQRVFELELVDEDSTPLRRSTIVIVVHLTVSCHSLPIKIQGEFLRKWG